MIDFMILGAQKAATSALQKALCRHPEIHMPDGESAFFEDPDFAAEPWKSFGDDHPGKRLKGIKRPDNLCSDLSIARISEALPNARFIVVLREPVSRSVSSHAYLVRHAQLPSLPLNEGINAGIDAHEAGRFDRAASIVGFGLYGAYLTKWFDRFDPNRFLVLSQERVRSNAADALGDCAAHLGVDAAPLLDSLTNDAIGHSNTGLYDPTMLRIARYGSLLKTRPIPGTIRREPRGLAPRAIGKLVTNGAETLASLRGQKRETLSPEVISRLNTHFEFDLKILRQIVNPQVIYWDTKT